MSGPSENTLRSDRNAHDSVKNRQDLDIFAHPSKLDPGAAAALDDWVDTFNNLAFADPKLLAQDKLRPGPHEHDRAKEEIALAVPLVLAAIEASGVVRQDAVEELRDQEDAAASAGDDLAGRQQADRARKTFGNFFAEALSGIYNAICLAPRVARGDGGFISKEIVSGVYRATGAATFAGAIYYTPNAAHAAPQILDFVLSNLDQLQAYCAVAFEHAPGAAKLLRWLESNKRPTQK